MLEFYDFLMHLVSEEGSSMEMAKVILVWQDFQLRKMVAGTDLFTPLGTPKRVVDERPPKELTLYPVRAHLPDCPLVSVGDSAEEFMWLLHEFIVFLGFEANPDKCEGHSQVLEFLGVMLSTTDGVCIASISEDQMLVVQAKEDGARFMDFRGHNYWGNLPFSGFLEIIQNFLRARDFLAMMFPATDDVLAWWIVFMVTDRKVKPSTAKKYTSSVRALHLQLGVGSREGEVDIRVRHSKTIEAGERYHTVRAVEVPDSPICVLMALWRDWQMPNLGPLFCTEDAKGRLKPLTHSVFVAGFRKLTARAGPDPAAYIGNSFRRGGATATCELQVQDALIQAHGDWASECYKLYCDMDSAQQLILPSAKATGVAIAIRAFEMRA
ncbi:hypothetical protein CYMTET_54105 [Cymbomonas tetramitiformis]|uniref:Uncharacterized protein n=1 Tax=Cymbomonas tetramitiformis TaxID=36881 RepID=A0AAE0BFJ1_9CHLO|nr:hypothetical protein CYMTET_54105 [Cymbomonas tetramitiformis]